MRHRALRFVGALAPVLLSVPACSDGQHECGAAPDDDDTDAAGDAGAPDEGGCAFAHMYSLSYDGGLGAYRDEWGLTPPGTFALTRTWTAERDAGPVSQSCMGVLEGCAVTDAQVPSLGRLAADFASADVQAAFDTADGGPLTVYGYDSRPVDGVVLVIGRDDGRRFAVGDPCQGRGGCVAIAPGVAALAADLQALHEGELASSACSSLATP